MNRKILGALIVVSTTRNHQTEKCRTEKWRLLFFCPTFFCFAAETMITAILGLMVFTFALSVTAYAQGSGSSEPSAIERSFAITRRVTGTVAEIKDDGKVLIVTDKKGVKHEFKADARMKMKVGDKVMKDGEPSFIKLQEGQMVKVTYREAGHTATRVEVIVAKNQPAFP
jgi:hypothetical protein